MSIIVTAIAVVCLVGWLVAKFHEGASVGSGYRQEKQNQQIIDELRKQNEELRKQNGGE